VRKFAQTLLVLSSVALPPMALADDKAKPSTSPLPKPQPALVEAFKGMTGTWVCAGKFKKPDGNGELDVQSTMVITSELDGFVYSGMAQLPKSEMLPNGMKEQMFWSYDSASAKLVEFLADSYGGVGHGTSDGLKGDTLVWVEDEVMMGKPQKVRTTVQHISPAEVSLTFDALTAGHSVNMGRNTCKKH
jgi:hypothetical protein